MPEPETDPYARTALSDPPPATDPLAPTHDGSGDREREAFESTGPDPLLGTRLAHFRIDEPLGRGGMGAVYRGWDTALERPVAIKVLAVQHAQARERFLREARAQAKVRHPNVVPIHFVGQQGDTVFLSMDLVEGDSVGDRLEHGPIAVAEALDVVDSVAQALAEGNTSGLIHRDVKPSNVLLTKDGRVLLADFGLAKTVGTEEEESAGPPTPGADGVLTQHGALVGTPAYMAPEQTRTGPVDHRADMYALGVTLFEMITGKRPFEATNTAELLLAHRDETPPAPRALAPDLPPALDALVVRLMSKDPAARFETYAELRIAIDGARERSLPSAGFFPRSVALAIDLVAGGLVALFMTLLHPLAAWSTVALLWGASEWRWGKTLGKRLFALRVVAPHDERPKLGRSLGRNAVKYWGPMAATLVTLDAWGHEETTEIVGLVLILIWAAGLLWGAGKKKLALHDRTAKTRVVYDLDSPRSRTGLAKVR